MVQIEDVLDVLMVQIVTGYGFEDLQIIQDAIDRRGPIPLNYFTDEDILGCGWRSKAELREIKQKIIDKIVSIINAQNRLPYKEKMSITYYARYLHALTILKVDKYQTLHKTCNDHIRNAMLDLWQFDDEYDGWDLINYISMHLTEAVNGIMGKPVVQTNYPED